MELEVAGQLEDVADRLDCLTAEWLQSLILDKGSVPVYVAVAHSVREDPEWCLKLLQVCMCESNQGHWGVL